MGQDQGQGLGQLGRRLQVLMFLSQRNQEPNPKILEMQEHITAWLQNGKSHNQASKVSPSTSRQHQTFVLHLKCFD